VHLSLQIGLAAAAGLFVFTLFLGATGSWPAALASALLAAVVARAGALRIPVDEPAASRPLKILSVAAALLAFVVVGRLAVFMAAPDKVGWSSVPNSQWELRHSCLTAYFMAAEAGARGDNIYDSALYTAPDDDPTRLRKARRLGPFNVDVYEYPPPFLILPRALSLVAPDFFRLRTLWFGLTGLVVLLAMVVAARDLGPAAGTRALLLAPLVWAALPTLSALQKGNAQLLVIAASMLAMACFERRRDAAGGALLAYVTVSKLFPGMLLVYLLARRQWRALGWTAAMGVVYVALTLADVGLAPFAAFLRHLPGLVGGEAFPAFRNPAAMAINFSVPGLVFKLKLFGVAGMGFGAAKVVGWIWTVVAVVATVAVARRTVAEVDRPLVWMAILILATLRSPFLPQAYAAFPPLWLLTLLGARRPFDVKTMGWVLVAGLLLNLMWPTDWPIDPRWLAVMTLLPQVVTVVLAVMALRLAGTPPTAVRG
jgi:alpha-1,2-mannosyltransferase